jgi:hypothetical protein
MVDTMVPMYQKSFSRGCKITCTVFVDTDDGRAKISAHGLLPESSIIVAPGFDVDIEFSDNQQFVTLTISRLR